MINPISTAMKNNLNSSKAERCHSLTLNLRCAGHGKMENKSPVLRINQWIQIRRPWFISLRLFSSGACKSYFVFSYLSVVFEPPAAWLKNGKAVKCTERLCSGALLSPRSREWLILVIHHASYFFPSLFYLVLSQIISLTHLVESLSSSKLMTQTIATELICLRFDYSRLWNTDTFTIDELLFIAVSQRVVNSYVWSLLNVCFAFVRA